ncbi:hypothetical protein [Desulfobacter hydrogenophilus]|nr:hypothetical protein [Desulfobacter hydrogenophilus]NDY74435.1 hypothetical protein [Desulfobacter hydrogenophilus]QBH13724.1 hypothetical protein EYB58_12815 [Desulfobacter hydrogenophilus]
MKLICKRIDSWPKLTWGAKILANSNVIEIIHGPSVEDHEDWVVEGCWTGVFEDGGFDQTDLIFGSGIRIRNEKVVFVSSGSTLDRLWWKQDKNEAIISNSLPAFLCLSRLDFLNDYNYSAAVGSIRLGLDHYQRVLPLSDGDINVLYYHNLIWDGLILKEQPKPYSSDEFLSFEDYESYLNENARALKKNAASKKRKINVSVLSTVSQGYDSLLSTVLAKNHMGCRQTVTIKESSSLWRGSDSGKKIAECLGIECVEYKRKIGFVSDEVFFWAVAGRAMELNMAQFDYPEPLCLFLTGFHGDTVWGTDSRYISNPFLSPSVAGMGISEYRLIRGIFHCPVPYWGIRHFPAIQKISKSSEMEPWSIGGSYDRPIPRRIVEEAGVPRQLFGQIKKNTQIPPYLLWPYSRIAQNSAYSYAQKNHFFAPSSFIVKLWRPLAQLDRLVYKNITERLGMPEIKWPWSRLNDQNILFQWANSVLRDRLSDSLTSHDINTGENKKKAKKRYEYRLPI